MSVVNHSLVFNKPQLVNRFQTSDGKLFENVSEANDHEEFLAFKSWYFDDKREGTVNILESGRENTVNPSDLFTWLSDHKEILRNFNFNTGV